MINAVPFRPGANGFVVPCGKVMTQFLLMHFLFSLYQKDQDLPISLASLEFHVRFTVIAPANVNNLLIQFSLIVSSAAT